MNRTYCHNVPQLALELDAGSAVCEVGLVVVRAEYAQLHAQGTRQECSGVGARSKLRRLDAWATGHKLQRQRSGLL